MSSLTISSTTAIVTPPEPSSPSTPTAANVVVPTPPPTSQPPPRRRRWPDRTAIRSRLPSIDWSKHLKLEHVQKGIIVGVAILEMLSIVILVVLNSAGQGSDKFEISVPNMYLLSWTKMVAYDASRDNRTEAFTIYWYLNGVNIQNGTQAMETRYRQLGADFNWRNIDNHVTNHIRTTEHPFHTCGALPIVLPLNATNPTNSTGSATSVDVNSTSAINTTAINCHLPAADEVTDTPPALNGQPAFGRASFAFFMLDILVTLVSWPFNFFLDGRKQWQKRGRILMACTKTFATTTNVIAAGLLISGMSWVAKHTSPDGGGGGSASSFTDQGDTPIIPLTDDAFPLANNVAVNMASHMVQGRAVINATVTNNVTATAVNSTMPPITAGSTATNLIWISVTSQVFACVFFFTACLFLSHQQRSRGERLGSGGGRRRQMRQRPGSLPVYRPRDSNARRRGEDGEEYEDLPPYQREDPLGRPPSIPGYTISNGCTVTYSHSPPETDCIPLHRVTSSDTSVSALMPASSASMSISSPSLAHGSLAPGPHDSDNSGRRSPSPDYEEVVGVEPVSLLSGDLSGNLSGDGVGSQNTQHNTRSHDPLPVTADETLHDPAEFLQSRSPDRVSVIDDAPLHDAVSTSAPTATIVTRPLSASPSPPD